MTFELKESEKRIGYTFLNKELLITAFTHSTYANVHGGEDNERLEFLGDSVLQMVVSEALYFRKEKDRALREGKMTVLRQMMVRKEALLDAVERLGVQRTRDAARQAALALLVLDGSRPLTAEDEDAIATAAAVPRQLVIVNKTDLPAGVELSALVQRFGQLYPLSAATGEGVDALCRAVEALYPAGKQAQGELLTNARQADAVARSLEAVRSARRALEDGMTPDVVLTDAEAALEALGELNGKRIREDLVQTIFSRFCVGK